MAVEEGPSLKEDHWQWKAGHEWIIYEMKLYEMNRISSKS